MLVSFTHELDVKQNRNDNNNNNSLITQQKPCTG